MRPSLSLLSCLAVLGLAAGARAHGGRPQTQAIHFAADDRQRLVVRATFGLLESDDGGATWAWTCQESIPSAVAGATAPGVLAAGGLLVLGGNDGLVQGLRSTCGWAREPTSASHYVADVVRSPDGRLLALTGDSGATNRLLESEDEGRSWRAVGTALPLRFLTERLRAAPSAAGVLYVSGQTYVEGTTMVEGAVLRSVDGGAHWTAQPVPLESMERLVRLVAVAPDDADDLWLLVQGPAFDRLLRSRDAGASWAEVTRLVADPLPQLRPFAWAQGPDGTTWFGNPRAGLSALRPDGVLVLVDKFVAAACLVPYGRTMWMCADGLEDGFALATFDAMEPYAPQARLRFEQVTRRPCEGFVECTCELFWDDFLREVGRGAEVPDGGAPSPCVIDGGSGPVDAGATSDGGVDGGMRAEVGPDPAGPPRPATCACAVGQGAGACSLGAWFGGLCVGLACWRRR